MAIAKEPIADLDPNSPRYLWAPWWTDKEMSEENLQKSIGCPVLDELLLSFQDSLISLRKNSDENQ